MSCRVGTLLLLLCGACFADKTRPGEALPEPAQSAFTKPDQFELYSLDPNAGQKEEKGRFHGWKVLGKTVVKDAETRTKLLAALDRGINENDGTVAGCFIPRHGLRAVHGGKTVDMVICFQCYQIEFYTDGIRDKGGRLVTASPQRTFNEVLKAAKVPLAK